MYQLQSDKKKLIVTKTAHGFEAGNKSYNILSKKLPDGGFAVQINDDSLTADIVNFDRQNQILTLRIKNKKYTVQIKDEQDLYIEKLGVTPVAHKKINNLKAPMPGLITKLFVQAGMHIKAGEPLLILEAMKMENVFKASADATIKAINVVEKQAVEKGVTLITFEKE